VRAKVELGVPYLETSTEVTQRILGALQAAWGPTISEAGINACVLASNSKPPAGTNVPTLADLVGPQGRDAIIMAVAFFLRKMADMCDGTIDRSGWDADEWSKCVNLLAKEVYNVSRRLVRKK
jgi:hypothetical protein